MKKSGIDIAELNPDIRPQDDLYRHVNGKWLDRTEIPADKARYGSFHILHENAEAAVRDIITGNSEVNDETTDDDRDAADLVKIQLLFNSYMDEDRLREIGLAPLQRELDRVSEVESLDDLIRLVAANDMRGFASFLSAYIDNDLEDPTKYMLFVNQGGITLPDESYYRQEQFGEIRKKFIAHIERIFTLVGVADAAARAQAIFELETKIAAAHWDQVRSRDVQQTYNPMSWAEFDKLTPNILWEEYFDILGVKLPAEVVVRQPSAVAEFFKLLGSEPLAAWIDWYRWRVVQGAISSLQPELAEANFEFFGTVLTGAQKQRERWRRGVNRAEGAMGEAVGRIYVAQHFNERAKSAMDELVDYLILAYRQSIQALDWMSEETKAKALDKLAKFTPKIGYPVKWRDYSELAVSEDLLATSAAVAEFHARIEWAKLGSPVDREEWFMTPQTVNAYYNPGFNEIVFPAAILQPPFFSADVDAATNFGAIGAVIGHEIGHGFDDRGSQYDGDGQLNNWWTDADRAAFEERTAVLIGQYDALSPEGAEGQTVNGSLTIGENIGDLAGLSIAWKAYLLYLADQGISLAEAPVIDGLSAAERFFYSWAQCWQQKSRPEETVRLLTTDPHSPNEFRCNQIVRNLDVFHETFGTKPGDQLWLDPADRVHIW
ncbi:M13 family metallopeptidase [Canibacter zhoujuaniae]|uniref:M13 family metallopeptidase n=1 Tax=Canibacter zhoujuaniae TaxID=2708343 RepID=UPI00141DD3F3|nr:M13-type metalloendopeptidase [Canibacter zhoujuaniae]